MMIRNGPDMMIAVTVSGQGEPHILPNDRTVDGAGAAGAGKPEPAGGGVSRSNLMRRCRFLRLMFPF